MNNQLSVTFDVTEGKLSPSSRTVRYQCADIYLRHSFCYYDQSSFLLFIGICYNQSEILADAETAWPQQLYRCFRDNRAAALLRQLDGWFSGVYYNAASGEVLLFSDHLATIPIFYCRTENHLIVDTDLFRLADEYRRNGGSIRLCERGAHSMLAYSFMLGCDTLLEGVYKVQPAGIYSWRKDKIDTYFHYYRAEKDDSQTLESAAETIDKLFSAAIDNSFSADGNSEHLLMLSGGLDSRMCLFYALRNGYDPITTLNYSQSFYREETIAKKIAAEHGCEHIFFSLDRGRYLSNIDEGIRATQGMTTYRPVLQARMIWNRLQMERFGFVHSGLVGDTIIGGYCIDKCNADDRFHSAEDFAIQLNVKNKSVLSAPYCDEFRPLFNRVLDWIPTEELKKIPSEQFVLDNRYINGLVQGSLGTRDLAVHSSAYTSKALMSYIFSIPSQWRLNHKLYFVWMNQYMPQAAHYQWENTGLRPMYGPFAVHPHDKTTDLARWLDAVIHPKRPERSRNPYKYWMRQNAQIEQELVEYCKRRLCVLEGYTELMECGLQILKHQNIYLMIRLATLVGFIWLCSNPEAEVKNRNETD